MDKFGHGTSHLYCWDNIMKWWKYDYIWTDFQNQISLGGGGGGGVVVGVANTHQLKENCLCWPCVHWLTNAPENSSWRGSGKGTQQESPSLPEKPHTDVLERTGSSMYSCMERMSVLFCYVLVIIQLPLPGRGKIHTGRVISSLIQWDRYSLLQ